MDKSKEVSNKRKKPTGQHEDYTEGFGVHSTIEEVWQEGPAPLEPRKHDLKIHGPRPGPNIAALEFRRLRHERGWTQADVERISGGWLYQQAVRRMEILTGPNVSQDMFIGLASVVSRVYGIPLDYIAQIYGYIEPTPKNRFEKDDRGRKFLAWLNSVDPEDYDKLFNILQVVQAGLPLD